jgi:uncharacterized protein YggT (Ycf19 family)
MVDEERRVDQYENVKGAARNEIQAEVRQQADQLNPEEKSEIKALGNDLKQGAISEVRETETEVRRGRGAARLSQAMDYLFYLIYGIISLQIVFDLFGASRSNGIRNFVDTLSWPLLAPFRNLFPDPAVGRFHFRFSYIAALVVYVLLHLAVNGLLRMIAHRKTAV